MKQKIILSKQLKINNKYVDSYNNLGVCLLELEKLMKHIKYLKML